MVEETHFLQSPVSHFAFIFSHHRSSWVYMETFPNLSAQLQNFCNLSALLGTGLLLLRSWVTFSLLFQPGVLMRRVIEKLIRDKWWRERVRQVLWGTCMAVWTKPLQSTVTFREWNKTCIEKGDLPLFCGRKAEKSNGKRDGMNVKRVKTIKDLRRKGIINWRNLFRREDCADSLKEFSLAGWGL